MMIKIWEKYLLKQFLGTLLLVLLGFYGLFVLLDFSTHASIFPHTMQSRWLQITIFYIFEYFEKIDTLLPFAVLIATIKTLCQLNLNNEIVAMLAGGVNIKRLIRPLIIVGFILVSIVYLNAQFLLPVSSKHMKHFTEERKLSKKKNNEIPFVQHLALADHSTLIFQNYDPHEERFFDAYWVRSNSEIYRIKHLYPHEKTPRGTFVEHLTTNSHGQLTQTDYFEETTFDSMIFNKKRLLETTTLPDELSLTELWSKIPCIKGCESEKNAKILTTFYYKMAIPWLCLLAIIAPAPFCLQFTRTLRIYMVYGFFTFALVSFYLIMDSAEVLGKRQAVDPFWAIFTPLIIYFTPALFFYRKLK
ncbi:MAG: LptF/LptG family permease [Chlamydiota bacterium]|nr:LptF/LptG family permease [Chlamydiota bacterium]